MFLKLSRPQIIVATIGGIAAVAAREIMFELVFGSAADWLKDNVWIIGDFLAWRWSSLILAVMVPLAIVFILKRFGLLEIDDSVRDTPTSSDVQSEGQKSSREHVYPPTAASNIVDISGAATDTKKRLGSMSPTRSNKDFQEWFGVLWKVTLTRVYISGRPSMTAGYPISHRAHVEGPYCPECREEYQFKNWRGIRHLMDNDTIGGLMAGKLYCPGCGYEGVLDPQYQGPRPISEYKAHIRGRSE